MKAAGQLRQNWRRAASTLRHLSRGPTLNNRSFLVGGAVGVALGLATSLYVSHYMLPERPLAAAAAAAGSLPTTTTTSHSPRFGGPRELARAIQELRNIFGDRATVDEQDCLVHGSSSWFPMHNDGAPHLVVYPHSTVEVQQIARIATKYRIPVISYGAGTSIEGQFSTPYGGICIDFSAMDRILEIQEDDMTVTLQPGVGWQALNEELDLRKTGLFFPVDPGPGASIGGCIGTSCSGPNAARYGTMKSWVVNCTVVTIDGQVFRTRSKAKKSSTGYDLNHLLIGAEGTLGLVTEITLQLTNKPAFEVVGTCAFQDVASVTRLVIQARKQGVNAQCMELLDSGNMPAINAYAKTNFPHLPHLFFKLSGSKAAVREDQEALQSLCRLARGSNFHVSRSAEEAREIWSARKNLLLASLSLHGDYSALSTDVCVPISKLPDLVTKYRAMSETRGIVSSILGHVQDGNFHSLILYDSADPESVSKAHRLADDLLATSLELEGTVSGEHGVGNAKRHFMIPEYGVVGVTLMQKIKDAWDPLGLLNPGKVLPDRQTLLLATRDLQ